MFIAIIKDSLCRVICRTAARRLSLSHYKAKAARFLSFYEKAQKRLNGILKYEYNFTSLIPFKSINNVVFWWKLWARQTVIISAFHRPCFTTP